MIDLIKRLVGTAADGPAADAGPSGRGPAEREVHLAACAVFLEMAHIDDEFDAREQKRILEIFQDEFGLSREEVIELKKSSREALASRKDYWKLTNVINRHYTNEEKYRLVELLWELVYADGKLDEHENYLMHKLVRLLHLTHRDLIDAKLGVLHRHGARGEDPEEGGR